MHTGTNLVDEPSTGETDKGKQHDMIQVQKQDKTGAGQGRVGQGRVGQGRAGRGRAGHQGAGQGRASGCRAGQGRASDRLARAHLKEQHEDLEGQQPDHVECKLQ